MAIKQQSFLRGSKSFSINGNILQCAFQSIGRDYKFDVLLSDIRPNFEEYRSVAWSWYLVGIVALSFIAFQFRASARLDLPDIILMGVYAVTAFCTLATARKRSGRYYIIKVGGDVPRSIWVLRHVPTEIAVDTFLIELKTAMNRSREPGPET
ncbi:MAG: hypothetical protein HOH58_09895 [Opitutaceae bacterium]|jgi:hypothetical protein|nr:hypothetical protein [Opitutaceae bacterium]